jgi:glyoxylase-like metal-dependent hydrolase (beta-lactamase superfamily II)
MEVVTGIHQFRMPLPDSPLGYVNIYLVRGEEGWLLVDTGWNTREALVALESQLKEIGLGFEDIDQIVVTHFHLDHYGLAAKLKQLSGATLAMHHLEEAFIQGGFANVKGRLIQITQWLRTNGMPEDELHELEAATPGAGEFISIAFPDITLYGDERISTGLFHFQVLWTPGHSPGHISLYEPGRRIFISGDHILPRITPNVSFGVQSKSNPLGGYLDSLKSLRQLEVDLVLPGHEFVFPDLRGRIDELLHHHQERMAAVAAIIKEGPETAYRIASQLIWAPGTRGVVWQDLGRWDRRMAVTETLAHLELLRVEGKVEESIHNGNILYSASRA